METAVIERKGSTAMTEHDVQRIRGLEACVGQLQFAHEGTVFDIPAPLREILQQAVSIMASGDDIAITPLHKELTTQEAADLLNVSRPHLVKLVEEGEIPHRKVGTRRRVQLADVLAYKEQHDRNVKQGLDEMADFLALCGTYDN